MPVIRTHASTDDLLDAVAQLPTDELSAFVERVAVLMAERIAPRVDSDEAALLLRIGRGLPADQRRRYEELVARRRAETLTAEEHAELTDLSDEVERLDAERAEAIIALAQRRGASLSAVMQSLGIAPAADGW